MVQRIEDMFPVPVYLDNNIIVAIEKKELSINAINEIVAKNNIVYGYSDAHIYETDTRAAFDSHTKEELVAERLNTIATITNNTFFNRVDNQMSFSPFPPQKRYKILQQQFHDKDRIRQGFIENMSFENRRIWREKFGLETGEINNQPEHKIFQYIAEKLKTKGFSLADEFKEFKRLNGATKKT